MVCDEYAWQLLRCRQRRRRHSQNIGFLCWTGLRWNQTRSKAPCSLSSTMRNCTAYVSLFISLLLFLVCCVFHKFVGFTGIDEMAWREESSVVASVVQQRMVKGWVSGWFYLYCFNSDRNGVWPVKPFAIYPRRASSATRGGSAENPINRALRVKQSGGRW